jgi:hypothetical protein
VVSKPEGRVLFANSPSGARPKNSLSRQTASAPDGAAPFAATLERV